MYFAIIFPQIIALFWNVFITCINKTICTKHLFFFITLLKFGSTNLLYDRTAEHTLNATLVNWVMKVMLRQHFQNNLFVDLQKYKKNFISYKNRTLPMKYSIYLKSIVSYYRTIVLYLLSLVLIAKPRKNCTEN